ncbi:MAG TPA: hypothetical protein VLA49_11480 [Anaerolineales bacterium]|nr:hypothetical protein [Anaerolineales bacterium]
MLPFSYYLAGSPTFRFVGLLLPVFQFGTSTENRFFAILQGYPGFKRFLSGKIGLF